MLRYLVTYEQKIQETPEFDTPENNKLYKSNFQLENNICFYIFAPTFLYINYFIITINLIPIKFKLLLFSE